MRQEKEISKNFYRFWRMSNLRGFLGRCAKVVANSKYFYNFGSMRQNVGELRKKSSPKFGFAKRCRIDPKFGASTQKASQIRHSPKFALFSGFKLWRIVRSPVNLVPLSLAANQRRGFMKILDCDSLPLKYSFWVLIFCCAHICCQK